MRKFDFETDNGLKLSVRPPKIKTYKKYLVSKSDDEIFNIIAEILSDNDENIAISKEQVENELTIDDLNRFYDTFPDWIKNEKSSDPN